MCYFSLLTPSSVNSASAAPVSMRICIDQMRRERDENREGVNVADDPDGPVQKYALNRGVRELGL